MNPSVKQKLPVAFLTAGILVLVVIICVAGVVFMQRDYATINDSRSPSPSAQESGTSVFITSTSQTPQTTAGGTTHVISISGTVDESFDAQLQVKRLYSLKNQFALKEFASVNDLSVSMVVQYAFCHLYYDSLVDMPEQQGIVLREATPKSIRDKITELFGDNSLDVTKSDLYNQSKDSFEMWQPKLRATVYANAVCSAPSDGTIEMKVTYFTTAQKQVISTVVTGVFQKRETGYVLTSMTTNQ